MRRILASFVSACAAFLLIGNVGYCQGGTFTLGFDGPAEFTGNAGDVVNGQTFFCTLTQDGVPAPTDPADPVHTGFGAQGWSISMSAEGAAISAITTAGTATPEYYSGGFNKTQITTAAGAGTPCEGKNGAVSAIVLSFTDGNVLPLNQSYQVAQITVDGFTIPTGTGTARLVYVSGCQGAGQPVQVAVTQGGETRNAILTEKVIGLRELVTCCGKPLNVGFSSAVIRAGTDPSAIVGETELCSAGGGSIVAEAALGVKGATHLYANVVSNLPGLPVPDEINPANLGGAQGWSFSLAVDGDIEILGATTAGTAAALVANGG
ncbi:MAG: hypothetical protein IT541_17410, partial [Hyphomicrobiales bacterium]|nr:hypothetical protein [Hyphomicrobiales bacterium]